MPYRIIQQWDREEYLTQFLLPDWTRTGSIKSSSLEEAKENIQKVKEYEWHQVYIEE